jgi:hypothetical protein
MTIRRPSTPPISTVHPRIDEDAVPPCPTPTRSGPALDERALRVAASGQTVDRASVYSR